MGVIYANSHICPCCGRLNEKTRHAKVACPIQTIVVWVQNGYIIILKRAIVKYYTMNYRTWKAGSALLCRIINKSSKSGGQQFQN